ncbi:VCBS repeat-containing protein [candidate division KSB1 bacterium]|nr:VCBS repeat-containing protein [candidate division KSB1 bacterium]
MPILRTLIIYLCVSIPFLHGADFRDSTVVQMFERPPSEPLLPDINDGYGIAFRDMNGDQFPDLYLVGFRSLNRLLVNRGSGIAFDDATIQSGLGGNLMPHGTSNLELGTASADFDNDGLPEILIAGWGSITTRFFYNNGQFIFKDMTLKEILNETIDANGIAVADVNLDGRLDFFLTDEHFTNRLFVQNSQELFTEQTASAGLQYNGVSQSASFCDIDLDGDPDLYVTNWFGPDLMYRNKGNGVFHRSSIDIEVCQKVINTNGVSFSDIDNDGDYDLFVTHRGGRDFLYRNEFTQGDTTWRFTDVTEPFGITATGPSYSCKFLDLNHDGWLDLFVTNIGSNICYLNVNGERFDEVYRDPSNTRGALIGYSTAAASADYDLDGDMDLCVANKDTFCILYENPLNDDRYIQFQIEGVLSNRDGIGTRIEIYKSGQFSRNPTLLGCREISGGNGYLSMDDPVVHFGLDTVRSVDAVFRFTSGKVITRRGLSAGHRYHIAEYGGIRHGLIRAYQRILHQVYSSRFWIEALLFLVFIVQTALFMVFGLRRYFWRPATTIGFAVGYFFMAVLILTVLQPLGRMTALSTVNILTFISILIFSFYSERLARSDRIRRRYRGVLIQLNQEIVHIHDNTKLLHTLVLTLREHTEFDTVCAWLVDQKTLQFRKGVCEGIQTSKTEMQARINLTQNKELLLREPILQTSEYSSLAPLFELCHAHLVIPMTRENHIYGILTLGTQGPFASLNPDDHSLFSSMANQMAISIENNAFIRKSNAMVKQLTEAKVREKYLRQLEDANASLDVKNQELQHLFDELKQTEMQLIQSEKMASLGQLVAGISHELNNPVGFIYGNIKQLNRYIQRLEKAVQSDTLQKDLEKLLPDLEGLIQDTITGSQSVKVLVDNLRKFSHLDQAEWKECDVHEGLDICLMILRPQLKNRIQIKKFYNVKRQITGNAGQLNQVFLNLLSNAAQAIPKKGIIQIRTEQMEKGIEISFQDDGMGILKKDQGRIFDPFFTTKPVGEGTGLGLSISYSIIKNHSGQITFDSEEGKGSRFTVYLPNERKKEA